MICTVLNNILRVDSATKCLRAVSPRYPEDRAIGCCQKPHLLQAQSHSDLCVADLAAKKNPRTSTECIYWGGGEVEGNPEETVK